MGSFEDYVNRRRAENAILPQTKSSVPAVQPQQEEAAQPSPPQNTSEGGFDRFLQKNNLSTTFARNRFRVEPQSQSQTAGKGMYMDSLQELANALNTSAPMSSNEDYWAYRNQINTLRTEVKGRMDHAYGDAQTQEYCKQVLTYLDDLEAAAEQTLIGNKARHELTDGYFASDTYLTIAGDASAQNWAKLSKQAQNPAFQNYNQQYLQPLQELVDGLPDSSFSNATEYRAYMGKVNALRTAVKGLRDHSYGNDRIKEYCDTILQSLSDLDSTAQSMYQQSTSEKATFLTPGAMKDGWSLKNLAKTAGATAVDLGEELLEGALESTEKMADKALYWGGHAWGLAQKAFGANEDMIRYTQRGMGDLIAMDALDSEKLIKGAEGLAWKVAGKEGGDVDSASVLGQKSDALANSMGQMLLQKGLGNKGSHGTPWWVTSGATAFGSELENAFRQGASYNEAGLSAAVSAGAEILSEKLFGGSALGEKGLINTQALTRNLSAGLLKTFLDYGIDVVGEGLEEVFSEVAGNLGSLLYSKEDPTQVLFSKEALLSYLDSFVGGAIMGGLANGGKAIGSVITKSDYHTNLEAEDQAAFTKAYKAAIAQARADGTRLNSKARGAIYDAVMRDVRVGNPLTFSSETNSPEGAGNATASPSINMDDLLDESIAQANGAPADPVAAALDSVKAGGSVSDIQARDILNNLRAIRYLQEHAGLKLTDDRSGGTAASRRAAVKEAIAQLAAAEQTQPIDTAPETGYDNENTLGGNLYDPGQAGQEVHIPQRGGETGLFEASGNTPAQAGNGFRIPGEVGTSHGESTQIRPDWGQRDGLTDSQEPYAPEDYIQPEDNSPSDTANSGGIKAQLRDSQDTLNAMDPVANIQTPDNFSDLDITQKKDWVIEKLRPTGYQVERKGFGLISFAKKQLKAAFNYFNKGSIEELTFEAIPYVLEHGVEISSHPNHKGREYGTVTIAAPVTVNGKRGNMAVVVKQTSGNFYKVHRIISPDGSVFDLSETKSEAELTPTGEAPETGSLATPKSSASNDSIPDSGEIVNPTPSVGAAPPEGGVPGGGVGSAPGWFDLNTRLQYEYGTIPEGENPVRPADLPKKDYTGKDVSKTAATVKGAKVTPDEFVDLLNKETVEGNLSYIRITNDAATQQATDFITEQGWELAKGIWENDVVDGKAGAKMSAIGALLLNNAAKAGDRNAWLDILYHYQMLGTNTAQGMQALRILKTLEPSDKLYMIERAVKHMREETGLDLVVDQDLIDAYNEADTDEGRDAAIDDIKQDIADQIPSTLFEQWNALRYVNMLGNLKTQARNVLGNLAMKALNATKNAVAVGLENIAYKVSRGKFERTKSLTVSKELMRAAKDDFAQLQKVIMGGGKLDASFDQATSFAQDVQDKRRIFGVKGDKWYQKAANAALTPLEGYRKVTNWAMEAGDRLFSKSAYARSLAGYLKAHGVTDSDLSKVDPELMDKARLYAVKEAQEVTFRDSNRLADWISKVGRRKDTPLIGKVAAEGTAPFRKTPANVLLRAEEYSPLGLVNSLITTAHQAAGHTNLSQLADSKNGLKRAVGKFAQSGQDITGAQVVNSWAKTLTGTGIFLLGMLLNNLGVLTAGPDEDDDKEAAESMNGQQNYALTIPGTDINITIDVFSSVAMPLLMGAELMEICNEGGFELKNLEPALMSIADPMIQMSMLQGVDDILTDIKYSDGPIGRLIETVAINYLMQGLTNSFLGQLERGTEDVRMTTYTDENSPLPKWLQHQLGKASAKIPGLDYHQTPYINAKGEEEKNPATPLNLLYNTASPVYIEQDTSTQMDRELDRLNKAQSDYNVYLRKPSKSLTINGEEIHLSAEQYETLCRTQGRNQRRLVEDIMALDEYSGLTDTEKAAVISRAYDYARDLSKSSVVDEHFEPAYITNRPEGMSEAEAILRQTVAGTTTKYTDVPLDTAAFVMDLMEGLNVAPRETKSDGTSYANVRDIQRMEAVVEADELDPYVEMILPAYMAQSTQQKYRTALDEGYTSDQFVAAYRLYLDGDKELSETRQIRELAEELDIDFRTAKTLWEIYSQKPD